MDAIRAVLLDTLQHAAAVLVDESGTCQPRYIGTKRLGSTFVLLMSEGGGAKPPRVESRSQVYQSMRL